MRTGEASPNLRDVLPEQASVGDSRATVRMKENPPLAESLHADRELFKEREPLPSAPRSGSASAGGNASSVTPNGMVSETEPAPKAPQTGRVGVKTREASGYRTTSSGADTAPTAAAQGKQKAVRETAERVAERRTDAISVKQESVSVPPETSVTPPEQSAVPVKMKETYAMRETPSADTPSAVQGKEKLVRERTAQVAGRRIETASAGQTPSPVPEQDAVPVKTREAYAQKAMPRDTQSAAQDKQKLVRERMERVARHIDVTEGRESAASANASAPISKREAVPVQTKEAYLSTERLSADTPSAAQGKGKLIRERTERFAGQRIDASAEQSPAVKVKTSAVMPEKPVPVRTKDMRSGAAKPQNIAPGKPKAVREQTERVAEKPVGAVSVKRESIPETPATTPERSLVKTKEAYLSTETPSANTQSAAQVKQKAILKHAERRREVDAIGREPVPVVVADKIKQNAASVKTREAYAQRETPNAMPETRTAVKERTAQIAERPAHLDSVKPEISEPPQTPVKTKKALIQSGGMTATETPLLSHDIPETAKAIRTERIPVKTKEAYAHWQTDAPPVADKSASVRRQAAVKTRKASIQTSASSVAETPKETGKTVRTKDGLIPSPATAAESRSNSVSVSPEPKTGNVSPKGTDKLRRQSGRTKSCRRSKTRRRKQAQSEERVSVRRYCEKGGGRD